MMNIKIIYALTLMSVLALTSQVAVAHGVKCGDLNIAHPYSPPTIGSGNTGAVYFMNIKNTGKEVDQLIGARTGVSSIVEIHEMTLENNVMKMRAIPEVQLPPGFEVSFKHGQANGYHLMLIDLKKSLKLGDKFPVILKFKKAGECQAEVWVETAKTESHNH
jgi:copper(I)-binding protein